MLSLKFPAILLSSRSAFSVLPHRQIQFIWYEVDTNVNSNEIFTKLNMGKVPLTNAELFKALLLGQKTPGCEEELAKIAFEWDRIEQSLHDNDFWYFISNTACGAETRIDYLLRLYVAHFTQDVPEKNDELYPFLTINDRINKKKKNSPDKDKAAFDECREIWEDIVSLFDKLSEWYRDNDLYHHAEVYTYALKIKLEEEGYIVDYHYGRGYFNVPTSESYIENISAPNPSSVHYQNIKYENGRFTVDGMLLTDANGNEIGKVDDAIQVI